MVWPAEPFVAFPDKSCMIGFEVGTEQATWWTTHAALAPKGTTLPAGIPGHYFVLQSNEDPPARYQSVPFVAEFEGADDAVILAYKVLDDRVYLYGTTAAKIISFVPPKERGKEVDEAAYISMWKLPHAGITGTRALANTETHKLKDFVDNFVQFLPLFKNAKLRNIKELKAVETDTLHKNITRACDAAELKLRRAAQSRGATSKDGRESMAGGQDAKKVIDAVKTKLNAGLKHYVADIEERFFILQVEAAGGLTMTPENLAEAQAAINAMSTPFKKEILEALDKFDKFGKEMNEAGPENALFADSASPLESVLKPAVQPRSFDVRQPEIAADEEEAGGEEAADQPPPTKKAKKGAGRPPGSRNKKQAAEGDEAEPEPELPGSKRLTPSQSAALQAKVTSLKTQLEAAQGQLTQAKLDHERALEKAQAALAPQIKRVAELEADQKQAAEKEQLKINAAVNLAKMQAMALMLQQSRPVAASFSSAEGTPSSSSSGAGAETPIFGGAGLASAFFNV